MHKAASLVWLSSAYMGAQMLSDVASLRIVSLAGLAVDGGTLIYPLTFTLRDLVHKAAGEAAARSAVFAAAAGNLVMSFVLWLVGILPPDPLTGPQLEFAAVLSPVWRIVLASIAAEVLGQLCDGAMYSLWERRFGESLQAGRVLLSNAVGIPLDSVVFGLGAFAGELEWATVWSIVVANILIKAVLGLASVPLIYLVPSRKGGSRAP